jgi:cysteine protease ATG4
MTYIYLFGKEYNFDDEEECCGTDMTFRDNSDYYKFLIDFEEIIWITYRKIYKEPSYKNLKKSKHFFVDDVGWGCTLRSAQMLIARILSKNISAKNNKNAFTEEHKNLLMKFVENPFAEYSILKFLENGAEYNRWHGPAEVSNIIKKIIPWTTVVMDSLIKIDEAQESQEAQRLLLVPLKLGRNSKISQCYIKSLVYLMKFPQFTGIIGGKNTSSLFIVGLKNDRELIYLDPHYVQEAWTNIAIISDKECQGYHTNRPLFMNISDIDPTMSIGFYCRNQEEYADFLDRIKKSDLISIGTTSNVIYIENNGDDFFITQELV